MCGVCCSTRLANDQDQKMRFFTFSFVSSELDDFVRYAAFTQDECPCTHKSPKIPHNIVFEACFTKITWVGKFSPPSHAPKQEFWIPSTSLRPYGYEHFTIFFVLGRFFSADIFPFKRTFLFNWKNKQRAHARAHTVKQTRDVGLSMVSCLASLEIKCYMASTQGKNDTFNKLNALLFYLSLLCFGPNGRQTGKKRYGSVWAPPLTIHHVRISCNIQPKNWIR